MRLANIMMLSLATLSAGEDLIAGNADILESLAPAVATATACFDKIPADRQRELKKVALFVKSKAATGEAAQVTFICTHNSRRSHLAQIWAQTAAAYYGVAGFKAFSGGVKATACNERTIAALKRAGFAVTKATEDKNPQYLVKYSEKAEPIHAYSKLYDAEGNPKENFVAVMTCDHADMNCPVVTGSSLRVPLHYVDPKVSDSTPQEAATYDERSQQIASEMFYMMSLVAKK